MNAVIYARYSSDNQREESIEGQIRDCMEYAKKNDINIIDSYIDRAFSAKTDRRPAFQRMIKASARHKFEAVLVWKLDRFARDRYDSARYKSALKKNGVKVISAMERISDGPEGIILESVLEGMAEYYSADLAEKVIRGHTDNALKCKYNGGTVPFGLMIDEGNRFAPDPKTAPVVLEIFQMYANGMTMKQIMDNLNERKIRSVYGNKFGLDTIRRTLSNRKYIGEYRYRDIVVEDGFPAIVPRNLFDKVQDLKEKNKKAPARGKAEEPYLLVTKLFCGRCGNHMDGECGHSSTGRRYTYYKCMSAKKKRGCTRRAIRKEIIEDAVVSAAMEKLRDDGILNAMADRVVEYQKQENTTLPVLERDLAEVNKGIDNLVNAIQSGMFYPAMQKRMEELDQRRSELETRILQEQIKRPIYTKEQILVWLRRFRLMDVTDQKQRKRLIDCFVKAVFLYNDRFLLTFNYSDEEKEILLTASETEEAVALGRRSDLCAVGGEPPGLISAEISLFFCIYLIFSAC